MARPAPESLFEETVPVPAAARFPVELTPPAGFDPARLETWPRVEGSLEWVAGKLLWMPPCGDRQHETVADVVVELGLWARFHPEFVVGTNEAGVPLGEDTRGADAAVWRRADLGRPTGGVVVVPPLLAVEVAGRYEAAPALRDKASLVSRRRRRGRLDPVPRRARGARRHAGWHHAPRPRRAPASHGALPGLALAVDDLFRQVGAAD